MFMWNVMGLGVPHGWEPFGKDGKARESHQDERVVKTISEELWISWELDSYDGNEYDEPQINMGLREIEQERTLYSYPLG